MNSGQSFLFVVLPRLLFHDAITPELVFGKKCLVKSQHFVNTIIYNKDERMHVAFSTNEEQVREEEK